MQDGYHHSFSLLKSVAEVAPKAHVNDVLRLRSRAVNSEASLDVAGTNPCRTPEK